MGVEKTAGMISVILGLIFIIAPMFSSGLVSVIIGLSMIFFGICAAYMGFETRRETGYLGIGILIIGIIAVIFGILFIFYIDALSFIIGLEFYVVGFIMIIFGIISLISRMKRIPAFTSILVLVMGIVMIALAAFAIEQPIFIAILIGVVLIIQGLSMMMID